MYITATSGHGRNSQQRTQTNRDQEGPGEKSNQMKGVLSEHDSPAHTNEGGEKNKVTVIAQVGDLSREKANKGQFQKKHQEAREKYFCFWILHHRL